MRRCFLLLALAALAGGAAPAAAADDAGPAATLADLFPEAGAACFARVYDKAHLAANPQQSVAFIALVRGWRELSTEAEAVRSNGSREAVTWRESSLRVSFRDGGRQRWETRAACEVEDGRILCGARDCDSGSFELKREADGRILVSITTGDHSPLRLGGGCGSGEASRGLGRNKADRVFRLAPAPLGQCR